MILSSLFWGFLISPVMAAPRDLDVAIVLDGNQDQSAELLSIYQSAFTSVIDPSEYTVRFLDGAVYEGGYSLDSLSVAYRKAQTNSDAEIVLVLGPQGAKVASQKLGSRPTLLPRVFDAELQQIGKNTTENRSNIKNLHLLDAPYQFQDDLASMSDVLNFSHLGVIVDQGLVDSIGVGEIEAFFKSISSGVRRVTVFPIGAKAKGILAHLSAIQDGAEAMYIASAEQLSVEERAKLITGLNQLKIPAMTRRGHQDVALGTIIGRSSHQMEMLRARQSALAALAIMNGQKAEQLPVHYSVSGQVQINMATAIALGISPPWSVLSEAEVVGVERLEDVGLSFTNALQMASEHPLILAAQAGSDSAAAEWVAARSGYLPQLHAFANGTTVDADRAQRLFQTLPQYDLAAGGLLTQDLLDVSKIVRIKAKKSESYAAAQDLEGLQRDLREDIALSYLSLLHARVVEQAYRERLAEIQNLRDVARRRADQDGLAKADVSFMSAQTTQLKQSLLEAQERSRALEVLFNQVTGQAINQTVSLSDQDLLTAGLSEEEERLLSYITDPRTLPTFLSAIRAFGEDRSPELAAADHRLDALAYERKAAKAAFFAPTISLYGNLSYHFLRDDYSPMQDIHSHRANYNSLLEVLRSNSNLQVGGLPLDTNLYSSRQIPSIDMMDWEAGVQVNYPLFNGLMRKANRDLTQANLEAGLSGYDNLKQEIDASISDAFITLNSDYRSLLLSKDALDSVNVGFQSYTSQYEQGLRTMLELNSASMLALDANMTYIDNVFAFRSSFVEALSSVSALDYYEDERTRTALFEALGAAYSSKGFFAPE